MRPSFSYVSLCTAVVLGVVISTAWAAPELPKPAQPTTVTSNRAWLDKLPFDDRTDFADAQRGLIAAAPTGAIRNKEGRAIWDFDAYQFESAQSAPDTVNPSLWRQAQLNNIAGLFKVVDRVYQIRGFDISNMTLIEGDTGLIIIDPLISTEAARAGLDLYYQHRPRRPVVALIYSHSHTDHFGGAKGVVDEAEVRSGKVKIVAPSGFMEEAISENVLAGTAMRRRAQYMYGVYLPKSPRGQVDAGLGKAVSTGSVSLIDPTVLITQAIENKRIDGVDIEFQLTPGTEAPSEMNLYFPQFKALCIAENATHTQHNILTIRGAQVRDAKMWSYYLGQDIALYGDKTDVLFAQHHWPTWGRERVLAFLSDQRDMYAFLHDQTLRLLNHGLTPMEIAEQLKQLPEPLAKKWYARDYYGSISHNVRAIYQRYLGFYDGNPATLNPLPPRETAQKTVEWMGGAQSVLERARDAFHKGEYRWVAQIVNQVVFADPDNVAARQLQADTLEQLGYQSENTTWRNAYLTGAKELRGGITRPLSQAVAPDLVRAMPPSLFFSYLGVRLNADKAAGKALALNWTFTDLGENYALTLRNSALTFLAGHRHPGADASLTLAKTTLDRISLGQLTFDQAIKEGDIRVSGDARAVATLLGMLDKFDLSFNIVTPR